MTERRARAREADITRAIKAAQKAGASMAVEIKPDGTIRLVPAEAGASAHQLMAMFGWTKLEEAERYTRGADRKRSAAVAAGHIVNNFLPHPEKGAGGSGSN